MTIRVDSKGKTYTDVVRKDEVPALIQTTANLIHGHIYMRPGLRLKDELNGLSEMFIAVTNAEVYNANGQVLVHSEFLTLNKNHIVWVRPDEEAPSHTEQAE
jgi:hypothetical protein